MYRALCAHPWQEGNREAVKAVGYKTYSECVFEGEILYLARRVIRQLGDGSSTEPEPDSSRPSSAESSLRGGTVALEAMEVMAKQREHARRVVDLAMAGTKRGRKTQEQVVVEIG